MRSAPADVRIDLLGRFRVVAGEREVSEGDWPARRAGELVALLALADGHALVRDQVVERLWPHLGARAGAANLRKAAHLARRAIGAEDAVVLRAGRVELFPLRAVATDVERFLSVAERALRAGDEDACARAAEACPGELLPGSPYEAWAQEPRRRIEARLADLLRRSGGWERLAELDPTDEGACRELMRGAIDAGRRHVAIRWYERLRIALLREMGARPSAETRALYERCTVDVRVDEPVFVGRELELAEVARRLGAARAGAVALVVRGPAGIGKSAFCREVARRAEADGWQVVTVTAAPSPRPYAAVGEIVEQLLAGGGPSLRELPARTGSVLAELTGAAGSAPKLRGATTRHQVVAACRRVLAASPAPALLCVENAHLLDEATAGALQQLAAAGDGPLALILACRAEWLRTSLPRGVMELARGDRATVLELGPLRDEEIGRLLSAAAPVPPAPIDSVRIVEAAGGSPFYALELAGALSARPAETLPETVREAVLRRLATLDRATIDALTSLAIAGDELDLATVLALTDLDEPSAFALLDAALDAGVLVVAGTRYRFRHALVRQVLTDELPAHRRLLVHRAAAGRLAVAGASPELVADLWLKGGRPAEARDWLLAATRRAMDRGAFTDALGQIERLLAASPEHHEGLCLHAAILDALGDPSAPNAYAVAAEALGDPAAQELRASQALAQLKASDPDGALRTLAGLAPTSTAGRLAEALTLSAAAAIGRYADADAAATKAQEAYELALELGDPGAILDATWAHALAAHAKGELPSRLREYLRATHALPDLATRVFDGQLCVTERMLYGGLPGGEIIAFADSLAAEARRVGAARGEAFARTLRGEALVLAGRLDEADADFAEGARLHGRIGAAAGEALSLLGRAHVATYRDRRELAAPLLADALLLARESEVGHHTLDRIYGAMVEAAGVPAQGLEVVCDAETAIRGPAETCPTCRIAFIVPAVVAAARAGDSDRAHRYVGDCERALEIVALPPAWHSAVEEARGWLARADGRREAAREHFRRAADGFRTWGQPLDARRCAELAAA